MKTDKKVKLDKESSLSGFGLNKARFAVVNVIKFLTRDCWDTLWALKPYSSLSKKEKTRITKNQYQNNTAFAIVTLSELFEACKAQYLWISKHKYKFFEGNVFDTDILEKKNMIFYRYKNEFSNYRHQIKITLKRFPIELNKRIREYIEE